MIAFGDHGQPGPHHHRPARHARSGGAFRPTGRRARQQRLSPAAPADADRSKRRFDGTHAIFAFAFDRHQASEVELAPELLRRLEPGMLCLADRAFVGFALWRRTTATGADLLWRARKNQVLPCCELLPDGSCLSRLHASPQHRRQDRDGVVVRVIDCKLEDVPGAEPRHRLVTTLLEPTTAPATELAAL
jgi:hypothetical protein